VDVPKVARRKSEEVMFKREDIMKEVDGKPVLYLRRWHLLTTPWFKIYLHKICQPDLDRDPHDHPWNSRVIMLHGTYEEELFDKDRNKIAIRWREALSTRALTTDTVHKITHVPAPVWTIMITGKKKKDWGFYTKEGWVYWRNYLHDYKVVEEGKDTRKVAAV